MVRRLIWKKQKETYIEKRDMFNTSIQDIMTKLRIFS